jgi:hypothetical protein
MILLMEETPALCMEEADQTVSPPPLQKPQLKKQQLQLTQHIASPCNGVALAWLIWLESLSLDVGADLLSLVTLVQCQSIPAYLAGQRTTLVGVL